MISLPPAIQHWINMLEATGLKQGRGSFYDHDNDCYCALGILCLANGKPPTSKTDSVVGNWDYVTEILGRDGATEAYRKNDRDRLSFHEIAKWAEVYFSEHGPHIDSRNKEPVT